MLIADDYSEIGYVTSHRAYVSRLTLSLQTSYGSGNDYHQYWWARQRAHMWCLARDNHLPLVETCSLRRSESPIRSSSLAPFTHLLSSGDLIRGHRLLPHRPHHATYKPKTLVHDDSASVEVDFSGSGPHHAPCFNTHASSFTNHAPGFTTHASSFPTHASSFNASDASLRYAFS